MATTYSHDCLGGPPSLTVTRAENGYVIYAEGRMHVISGFNEKKLAALVAKLLTPPEAK
jgi:hypothetical protein